MPGPVVEKARLSARAALDKRAQALQVLDLAALSGIADYFVLCTGSSTTHVRDDRGGGRGDAQGRGLPRRSTARVWPHRAGCSLDYGDVVVHVFLPETRTFYALDRLWGDAPEVPIEA